MNWWTALTCAIVVAWIAFVAGFALGAWWNSERHRIDQLDATLDHGIIRRERRQP